MANRKRTGRLASLERDNKLSELDEIRLHAPKAIPNALMRTLWRLLLSGRVKSPWRDKDLYRWKSRLKREGLTTTLRLEIRELLAPKVVLKEPFRWGNEDLSVADETSQIKQMVDWELVLAADHVHSTLRDLSDETWQSALPYLLDDFQQLLRDALDLLHELGEANDRSDRSHWDLPSITPHWQNRGFHDWVSLIELLRDAWLAVHAKDRVRASRIAENWFDLPYSTFKRLALFAASQDHCIPCQQWVGWLLSDDAWWLWNTDTMREVYRLFVLQGKHLAGDVQDRLEMAILAGPPREMYRSDLEADRWQRTVDRSIWLHFAKLKTAGLALGQLPTARFTEISNAYPRWRLETNERDEFSHWSSGTGDPDYVDSRDVNIAPRKRDALVQWLTQTIPEQSHFYEDTWRDVCQKHLLNSLCALSDLAHRDEWPLKRWQEALQAWSSKRVRRSWRYAAPLVQTMPDSILQEADHAVAWWLQAVSKSINCHEDILLDLCRRILGLQMDTSTGITRDGEPIDSPVTEAINHPIGYVTQALINLWFKQNPNDNDLLPKEVKEIFTVLCDVQVSRFRHARVLLGSRLIALFRVDHHWTTQYLLPLLDWSNPDEAKAVWEGFLWSPRLYQPLLIAFKPHFLDSANHYAELGEHQRQFATFLTYAALGPVEGYTVEEFRSAIAALPKEGLEESVQALTQALEGAAEQSEDYWKNRAHPFWQQIWPKSRELATPRIAELLSRLVIAARGEFPSALAAVQAWLQPFEHPSYVIGRLHDSGLCAKFPAETLILLNAVITNQQWLGPKFALCLDQILQVSPNIERDPRYLRLREHSRR